MTGGVLRGRIPADHFTIIPNDWARDATLSWKARGLLAYLASHSEGFRVSLSLLMRAATDGRESLMSGLAELEESGYLVREQGGLVAERRGFGGRFAPTSFMLTDPGNQTMRAPESSGNPPERETRRGLPDAGNPPLKKNKGEDQETATQSQPAGPLALVPLPEPRPDPFDAFWAAYPRKVKKEDARRAWRTALRRAPADRIIAAAKDYPFRSDLQYVMYPATWLRSGAWEDDPAAVRPRRDNAGYGPSLRPSARPEDYHDPGWHPASHEPPDERF